MRGKSLWIVAGALAAMFVNSHAPAADKQPAKTTKAAAPSWWNPWAGWTERAADKKVASKTDQELTTKAKILPKTDADPERAKYQQDLLRRLDACDQLRSVAAKKHDDSLMRQAENLDAKAWELYMNRVASSPAGQAAAGSGDMDLKPIAGEK